MTVDEALERAFDLRGTPRTTRDTYRSCIHIFEKYVGRDVTALGRQEVEQFMLHLARERRLSASSHNVYAAALRFLYDAALDRPEVTVRVPRRKQPMRLPVVLTPSEIVRVVCAVPSMAVRTVLLLVYGAGLRVSEACKLSVADIDSESMLLHVRHAKRGRERYVMLSARLLAALRAYWRRCRPAGPALFPGRGGKGTLRRESIARAVRRALRRAGIDKHVTVHTLRHCFATSLLEQGVDLRTVQVLLGHASLRSTTLYVHISTARVQRLASPLDRLPPLRLPPPTSR